MTRHFPIRLGLWIALSLAASGCGDEIANDSAAATAPTALSGRVTVDGSTTVLPVSTMMADEFKKAHAGVQIDVESSGTGGGFKKFCAGGVDIAGASRPIDADESRECRANQVDYIELPVGFDSLTVVVNRRNSFVDCLTVPELKKLWGPAAQGQIRQWNQVRASFPAQPIALFGPGPEHGTFDYFTLAVVGTTRSSRSDYTKSDDGKVLVDGVATDPNALGYVGAAYYQAERDKLRLVAIDNGNGCVLPSTQTVEDSTYQPLSRPLFIYISKAAAGRAEARALAQFFVAPENSRYVREVGYVPLSPASLLIASRRLHNMMTGSMFKGSGPVVGVPLNFAEDEDQVMNALVQ